MVEQIKRLNESCITTIEEEGVAPNVMFRVKTTYKDDLLEETLVNAQEFIQMYRQLVMQKTQMARQLQQLQMQNNQKIWLTWPTQIEALKRDVEATEKQETDQYLTPMKTVTKLIPPSQLQQMFRGLDAKALPAMNAPPMPATKAQRPRPVKK